MSSPSDDLSSDMELSGVQPLNDGRSSPMDTSSPPVDHGRTFDQRPLFKMTVELLNTYKRINAVYYEKKKYNDGFDDRHGDYILRGGDVLGDRYVVGERLGAGSFGQVVRCVDMMSQQQVAVKILKNRKPFYNQGLVEVRTLRYLNGRDPNDRSHTVRMLHSFVHRQHLCIVFELLSVNLYDVLRGTSFQGLSVSLVRRITHQIVHALYFLHAVGVIHCDLKPENVLLKDGGRSTIKVIDFGSSCLQHEKMFKYIQSRFYRAPEVILELDYGCACDMWSLGCIMVELITGDPLFPGDDEQDQLARMVELLGMPPSRMIEGSPKCRKMFIRRQPPDGSPPYWELRRSRPPSHPQRTLDSLLQVPSTIHRSEPREKQRQGIITLIMRDLVSRMLQWDPRERITPIEALHHYFFCAEEIARHILDCGVLQRPNRAPAIPAYPSSTSLSQSASSSSPSGLYSSSSSSNLISSSNNNNNNHSSTSSARSSPSTVSPPSRHARQSSRQLTEQALREASRLLDKRMPGLATRVLANSPLPPDEDELVDEDEIDLERQINNMSISPREFPE